MWHKRHSVQKINFNIFCHSFVKNEGRVCFSRKRIRISRVFPTCWEKLFLLDLSKNHANPLRCSSKRVLSMCDVESTTNHSNFWIPGWYFVCRWVFGKNYWASVRMVGERQKWCLISCFVLTTKEKTGGFPPNRNDNSQLFPRCRQKFFSFDLCEKHAHRVRFQWERGVTIREGRFAQYHSIFTSDGYYFVCTVMTE